MALTIVTAVMEIDLRVRKWDVVDSLRRQIGARSYAQIVSNSTSYDMLQRPELNSFGSITAYMYACDFQRAGRPEIEHLPTLEQIEATVRRNHVRADIIFADPWHSYDDSLRVLRLAYDMLTPGGYLVVHDCNPDQPEYTVSLPESFHACWCGETWRGIPRFHGEPSRVDGVVGARKRPRRRRRAGTCAATAPTSPSPPWLALHGEGPGRDI